MILSHITKPGHQCSNPLGGKASFAKGGEIRQYGEWEMFYSPKIDMYIVCRADRTGDYYEFSNYNCANAQLFTSGSEIATV